MIFNMTGGANPLNFKVVGNPKPANPKENTIWIDTDIPIPIYVICPPLPGEAPYVEEGFVWIVTGNSFSAAFNALKKDALVVCPISAKQYIGGAWVNKSAEIYLNGTWTDWSKIIVPSDEFTWYSLDASRSTVTKNPDGSISITGRTSDYYGLGFTREQFDLTGYNKMEIVYTATAAKTGSKIGVSTTPAADHDDAFIAFINVKASSAEVTESLDISGINRSVFFGASQMNANITIHEIRLSA